MVNVVGKLQVPVFKYVMERDMQPLPIALTADTPHLCNLKPQLTTMAFSVEGYHFALLLLLAVASGFLVHARRTSAEILITKALR